MNPLLHALPLDLTGKSINNLVPGEPHDLSALVTLPYRCFVLNHGYFFKDSLELEDNSGQPLHEGEHYQVIGTDGPLMNRSGLTVASVVVITNPTVGNLVYATAQMVGGAEGRVDRAIANRAQTVFNTNRAVFWKDIKGKPDAYTASGHLHAMWQLFGFEGMIADVDSITAFLKKRSGNRYAVVKGDFDAKLAAIKASMGAEDARLAAHIANQDNPHKLTAAQVSLEQVRNFGIATDAETSALATSVQNKYLTPRGGSRVITANFIAALNAHIADKSNPHQLTPTQVDSYTTTETNNLFNTKLGKDETVVNSLAVQGVDFNTLYNNLRANLDTSMVQAAGRFAPQRLGNGNAYAGTILTGAGAWREIAEIFAAYAKPSNPIYYVTGLWRDADWRHGTDDGFNYIQQAFANYPVGTLVIYTNQHVMYGYNGNGTAGTPFTSLMMAAKTANGWIH